MSGCKTDDNESVRNDECNAVALFVNHNSSHHSLDQTDCGLSGIYKRVENDELNEM